MFRISRIARANFIWHGNANRRHFGLHDGNGDGCVGLGTDRAVRRRGHVQRVGIGHLCHWHRFIEFRGVGVGVGVLAEPRLALDRGSAWGPDGFD
jgi:hypothetical protein